MARPRDDPPPGAPACKKRPWQEDGYALGQIATLGEMRKGTPWIWLCCRNRDCGRTVPIAIVPLIIRFGPDYDVHKFQRAAKCTDCGHRGISFSGRSWHDSIVGYAPWPMRFVTDARGLAVEPNRPTHYGDGRPMLRVFNRRG